MMVLFFGILLPIISIGSVWFMGKLPFEEYKLTIKRAITIGILSSLGVVIPGLTLNIDTRGWMGLVMLVWLLVFTSYTDYINGLVFSSAVWGVLIWESFLVFETILDRGITSKGFLYLSATAVLVVILCLVGLAKADGAIYFSIFACFFIQDEMLPVVMLLIIVFVSNVAALVMHLKVLSTKEYKKTFPFTSYILFGYLCAVSAMLFLKIR